MLRSISLEPLLTPACLPSPPPPPPPLSRQLLTLPMFEGQDHLMPSEVLVLLLTMRARTLVDVLELMFAVYSEGDRMDANTLFELLTIFHYQDKGVVLTDEAMEQLGGGLKKVPVVTMDDLFKHPVVQQAAQAAGNADAE